MRRAASSRPRRCGIDTMSGLDNWNLHQCASHMGHAEPSRQRHEERAAVPVATAHAAPARRARLLMAGRVAGGAGLAGSAALLLHLMSGRVAGGAGLALHRAAVLHLLVGCTVRHTLA